MKNQSMYKWVLFGAIVILLLVNGILFFQYKPVKILENKGWFVSPWYAVHLANGQVYFGAIDYISDDTIALKKAYHLQVKENTGPNASSPNFVVNENQPQTTYVFTPRGSDEFTLTDHAFFINRSAVLFWEKLDPKSGVMKLIEDAERANK